MITFKSLKFHDAITRETVAYTGKVYWDGAFIGSIRNDGNGGMSLLDPFPGNVDAEASVEAHRHALAQTYDAQDGSPPRHYEYLEDYIDDCAIRFDADQRLARKFRRLLSDRVWLVKDGKLLHSMGKANRDELPDLIERIRQAHAPAQVLNEMPFDEALKVYSSHRSVPAVSR